jgi:hypothetical protein
MLEAVYFIFFWFLILQALIFLFLNLPSPRGVKGKLINFISNHKHIGYVVYVHVAFCLLAGFFMMDLHQEETHFTQEKEQLRNAQMKAMGWGNCLMT